MASTNFAELLEHAVTDPGTLSTAFRAFHNYSLGNQILALIQCSERNIAPGPIATFHGWSEKGRYVRKGEKALTLCMPIIFKRKAKDAKPDPDAPEEHGMTFVYKPRWFVLAQTEGDDVEPVTPPEWDLGRALDALKIQRVPFTSFNGNLQGYARIKDRTLALNPLGDTPELTAFHEIAHVLLHSEEELHSPTVERNMREVEAEGVALLVGAALGIEKLDTCRGYIQDWNRSGQPIPEKNAARIFRAADAILKAGQPKPEKE